MKVDMKIEGVPELVRKMKHFNLGVGQSNARLIPQAARMVLLDMKANAPVETGRLRNALEARITKTNEEYTGAVVGITREASRANPQFRVRYRKKSAFYPASQEYGWTSRGVYHSGKPYIRPSFDKNRRVIIDKIASGAKDQMNLIT